MKKIIIISVLLTAVFFCWSACQPSTKPERVARQFLSNFYKYDLDGAMRYADDDSMAELKMIREGLKNVDRSTLQKTSFEILDIVTEGDTAVCRYILKQDEKDAAAISENLTLVRHGKKWKARY